MIRFSCPTCGNAIKAPTEAAGKIGKCQCGARLRIPFPRSASAIGDPPPPYPVSAPSPVPALSELPEWLVNAYPHASPAVLQSLREKWRRDAQQTEGDGSVPASHPATAPLPSSSVPIGEASPSRPVPAPLPAPAPKSASPTGEMILCYACRKRLADTALTCPKCGAVQTPEGREKGRQMKKREEFATSIIAILAAVPFFLCCFGIMCNSDHSSSPPGQRVPAGWDMDKLKQDADDVARDPSKTIFIPSDGSQPRVVPNR